MSNYIVNWALSGFRKVEHRAGDIIQATETEAKQIEQLVKAGVLSLWGGSKEAAAERPDLTSSTTEELQSYAKKTFDYDLDGSLSNAAMLAEISSLEAGGESTDDGDDDPNPDKPVEKMNKAELVAFAKKTFDYDLNSTLSNAAMRAEIASLQQKQS